MVFTKLGNDVLVNNISLLYIKLNSDKQVIEYVLANRKKIVEKFDTLEEMYAAYSHTYNRRQSCCQCCTFHSHMKLNNEYIIKKWFQC